MAGYDPSGRGRDADKRGWEAEGVRALRRHLGLSQRQMAAELGTRQQTVSEWETGLYRPRGASPPPAARERGGPRPPPPAGPPRPPPHDHRRAGRLPIRGGEEARGGRRGTARGPRPRGALVPALRERKGRYV